MYGATNRARRKPSASRSFARDARRRTVSRATARGARTIARTMSTNAMRRNAARAVRCAMREGARGTMMTPKSTTAPRAGTMVNASEGCARATRCARANAKGGEYILARAMMGADARNRDRDATRDGSLKTARSGSGTLRSARRTTTDGGARTRETNVGCRRT